MFLMLPPRDLQKLKDAFQHRKLITIKNQNNKNNQSTNNNKNGKVKENAKENKKERMSSSESASVDDFNKDDEEMNVLAQT